MEPVPHGGGGIHELQVKFTDLNNPNTPRKMHSLMSFIVLDLEVMGNTIFGYCE